MKVVYGIMAILTTALLLLILLCLTGCSTAYKTARDIKKFDGYFSQYTAEGARMANIFYPCFTGKAKSDTVVTFSKPDTAYLPGSTIITTSHDTIYKTVILPGKIVTRSATKTIRDTVIDRRSETVAFNVLKVKSDSLLTIKTNLVTVTASSKKWCLWFWLLAGSEILTICVYAGIKIYKLINGGAVASGISAIEKKL